MAMHEDQLEVDEKTVRRLVSEQFPELQELAIRHVPTSGTVNAIFRIGADLAARFPLQALDPSDALASLTAEAAAARKFADACPVSTPQPFAIGHPGHGYPSPWSIQTWLEGHVATVDDPARSNGFAQDLATLIRSLRAADTCGRHFEGEGRGGDLPDHDAWMNTCFAQSEDLLDVPRLRAMWSTLRTLPSVDADVMCHGDLTPPNVLVQGGRLVGVLDSGGFAAADPALDLVAAWHLLDPGPRGVMKDALRCSEIQWRRGMAWAFQQSMGLVWYYAKSNPTMSRWGRRTLERLLNEGAN
jgi:aminoglycoside phosphotransferase (APT) family kinase protein